MLPQAPVQGLERARRLVQAQRPVLVRQPERLRQRELVQLQGLARQLVQALLVL